MNASRALVRGLVLASVVGFAWGCSGGGDGLPRRALSGKVTLDGKPLETGLITFLPAAPGDESTSSATQITDGAFSVPQETGLVAGKYRVAISVMKEVARKGAAKKQDDEAVGDFDTAVSKESIPARYNARSELSAEVADAGANEFTFELKSK